MKIELLYFPGCPNVAAARELLAKALEASGVDARVEEVDVTAPGVPERLQAWGSPTILVDGKDVAGAGSSAGASCRLYQDGGGATRGVPPEESIRRALGA